LNKSLVQHFRLLAKANLQRVIEIRQKGVDAFHLRLKDGDVIGKLRFRHAARAAKAVPDDGSIVVGQKTTERCLYLQFPIMREPHGLALIAVADFFRLRSFTTTVSAMHAHAFRRQRLPGQGQGDILQDTMTTLLRRRGSLALTFALLVAASSAFAQNTVMPADAAKFMGAWALSFEGGPQGTFTIAVSVKEDNGQLAAEVSSDFDPTPIKVKDISKAGDSLVLKYTAGPNGEFAVKLTLTPDGDDKLKGSVEAGDGQFSMSGTGLKKK
jgi:uncharacterized protein (DUF2141 family)